jgi:hypothetical protein
MAPGELTIPNGQRHFCVEECQDAPHGDGKSLPQPWASSGGSDLMRTGAGRSLRHFIPLPFGLAMLTTLALQGAGGQDTVQEPMRAVPLIP